jgi:hypothetical protein
MSLKTRVALPNRVRSVWAFTSCDTGYSYPVRIANTPIQRSLKNFIYYSYTKLIGYSTL